MNKPLSMAGAVCAVLLFIPALFGQADSESPAPNPPFVQPKPAEGSWSVKISFKARKASPHDPLPASTRLRPVRLDVDRNRTTIRERVKWSDGVTVERWFVDRVALEYPLSAAEKKLGRWNAMIPGIHATSEQFDQLDWLSKDNYQGTVMRGDQECHHFEEILQEKSELDEDNTPVITQVGRTRSAWIRVADRRPLAFQDGGLLCVYEFHSDQPPQLALPPELAKKLGAIRKRITRYY